MTADLVLHIIAAVLVLMGVVNVYFVWHSRSIDRAVQPRSTILLALFGVSLTVWLVGVYIAILAIRVVFDLPALPFQGIGVGIAILILELLPAFIWYQMRKHLAVEVARDEVRDNARDEGRDEGRDEIRDEARDIARDAEHDNGS